MKIGIAFNHLMLSVPGDQSKTEAWLRELAAELGVPIGGSFLTLDGVEAHNTLMLVFPDGTTHTHQKDLPTMVENAHYVGDDDWVVDTPSGELVSCSVGR